MHTDTLKILSKFKGKINGIMHCFSGSREMAEQSVNSNFYISFAEPVTFPNSHKLHTIAKWIDLNRILLETGSPWLAPQEMRGKRNEPAFLPFIAKKLQNLKESLRMNLPKQPQKTPKKSFNCLRVCARTHMTTVK